MSKDKGEASGDAENQSNEASGDESKNQQNLNDKVSYETYRKTVEAEKAAKKRADDLARKLKEKEDAELQAQGKDKEVIESLRSQLKEKDTKLENIVGNYAFKSVAQQIKDAAVKAGCIDADLLIEAGQSDFNKIEVDAENGFSVNESDVKAFIENRQKKHPSLFRKVAPKLNDGAPANQKTETFSVEKLSALKKNDLEKLLAMKLAK